MAKPGTAVNMSEILGGLRLLGAAKESIGRAMGAAMGADVRDEAKMRAPVGDEMDGSKNPGLLQRSIYVAYDDRAHVLSPNHYRYNVSWNSKKAPHGHLLEFGHWMPYQYRTDGNGNFWTVPYEQTNGPVWVAARPFLGPAWFARRGQMLRIATEAGSAKFKEVMAK